MTQSPYSPQNEQQPTMSSPDAQPMNFYPAPGSLPAQADAKPAWPTVVGIISLCIGVGFGLWTTVALIINAAGLGNAQQREMMESVPEWVKSLQLASGLFAIATYVLLAIGGAALLKRRRLGRTLHVAYALAGIVMAIAGTAITVTMMNHMQAPANTPGEMQQIFRISMIVGAIIGLPIALAYPVFLLIWFGRAKIKQHVQTWQN